jgi:hypothetical protein
MFHRTGRPRDSTAGAPVTRRNIQTR